jgi:hypothetical protein
MQIKVALPVYLNRRQIGEHGKIPKCRVWAAAKDGRLTPDAIDAIGNPLYAANRLDEIVRLLTPPTVTA